MVSVALMTIWGVIDFFLLAAGGLTIAFSIMWRAPDVVRNLVLTNSDLTFGMVVGIFYAVTFVVSVGAIIQQNHVTIGLVVLNWLLIIDTIVTTIYGSTLWFMTLQEQANFKKIWIGTTPERRIALQDNLKCCGYDNDAISGNRLEVQIGGQTCVDEATARGMQGCMDPFVKAGDDLLMNTFTFMYGFVAILVCLFVATLCVMKKRQEQERFRRIDAKRGGRGFV